MRRGRVVVVAAAGLLLLPGTAHAADAVEVTSTNITAELASDGSVALQLDLDVDVPASTPSFQMTLPTRLRVAGDDDVWQILDWDSLRIRDVGAPVEFTTARTDDAVVVTTTPTRAGKRWWTVDVVVRGTADARTSILELPRYAGRRTTLTLRGPGRVEAVQCRDAGAACAQVTNQNNLAVAAQLGPRTAASDARVTTTWSERALNGDSRRLVERLTPRTWWRHWWPAVAGGVLGLAAVGALAIRARRRARPEGADPAEPQPRK